MPSNPSKAMSKVEQLGLGSEAWLEDPYIFTSDDLFHPMTNKRFWVFEGNPGVGKSYTLAGDLKSVMGSFLKPSVYATSQTRFAVGKLEDNLPNSTKLRVATLHSLIYRASKRYREAGLMPPLSGSFKPGAAEMANYADLVFDKTDDDIISRYERDAPSLATDETKEVAELLREYDPETGALPNARLLGNVPNGCQYDQTLLFYLLATQDEEPHDDRLFREKGWDSHMRLDRRPWIFVDEGQDFTWLQTCALLRWAKLSSAVVRVYGDPNQAMGTKKQTPPLFELAQAAGMTTPILGDPDWRRCPYPFAELAYKVLPRTVPPPEQWSSPNKVGIIESFSCPRSRKRPVSKGISISVSRYECATAIKYAQADKVAVSPKAWKGKSELQDSVPVFSTSYGAKGYESDIVTIQRWSPKHMGFYREGCPRYRRQLFVAITRAKKVLFIHEDMLEMIYSCYEP